MYYNFSASKKKETVEIESIPGIPEVGDTFHKYYFKIDGNDLLVHSTKIVVTRVVRRAVWYDEGTKEKFRAIKEGRTFDDEVVSSSFGLSIVTSKGDKYAKEQIRLYLEDSVRRHEEALAKAVKRRDMVVEAMRLIEPVE